jgi:DNA repair protein RecO (recombination protein O)
MVRASWAGLGMASSRISVSTRATLIHLQNYGESHRWVEAFTLRWGRVRVLARGARASKKRFQGKLDLFNKVTMHLLTGKEPWTLKEVDVHNQRLGLRSNIDHFTKATILCESIRYLAPEHTEDEQLGAILDEGLDRLSQGNDSRVAQAYRDLIRISGFWPSFACSGCGRDHCALSYPDAESMMWCVACSPKPTPLSAQCIGVLEKQELSLSGPNNMIENLLLDLIESHCGRPLKSRRAMRMNKS